MSIASGEGRGYIVDQSGFIAGPLNASSNTQTPADFIYCECKKTLFSQRRLIREASSNPGLTSREKFEIYIMSHFPTTNGLDGAAPVPFGKEMRKKHFLFEDTLTPLNQGMNLPKLS
jgi:hypothetical protein